MPVYPVVASNTSCATPGCWCRDRVGCYPSDLTDQEWDVLRPEAEQVMADLRRATGRPMVHDLRAMLDGIGYVAPAIPRILASVLADYWAGCSVGCLAG